MTGTSVARKGEAAEPTDLRTLELRILNLLQHRVRDLRLVPLPRGLLLAGRVPTYHARQLADQALRDLAGAPVIVNDLEVA